MTPPERPFLRYSVQPWSSAQPRVTGNVPDAPFLKKPAPEMDTAAQTSAPEGPLRARPAFPANLKSPG